ncbi:MAG TPA: CDP-alcohol phosphatidyltransferase family protein [Kofleriaceae bacterium]|nr:CDP-alcohol phosphatidyltransferase family protein [Kofleriaceae bacterium]
MSTPKPIEPTASPVAEPAHPKINGSATALPGSTTAPAREFDTILIATGSSAFRGKVCGLTLAERGIRVAKKSGTTRIHVVSVPEQADKLPGWIDPSRDLLILNVSTQVVHFPLVEAVRGGGARVAITPEGDYAGAIWVPAAEALAVATQLAGKQREPGRADTPVDMMGRQNALDVADAELARQWRESRHATEHVHGPIARHRAVSSSEREAATKMLFQLIHKPDQDGFLSKYLFRPIAYPITRAFLPTPITPNGVTAIVAVLALGGCIIVAGASYWAGVIGTMLQHVAGYFDCTDGEIARLRHEGSKFGQWFDTLTDEATTVGCLAGVGIHVYQRHPDWQWLIGPSIPIGLVGSFISLYVIYYYLIKVARSGNSQDYPVKKGGKLEVFAQLLHRDFIGLAVFIMAIFNILEVAYIGLCLGGIVSGLVLIPEHLQLRKDLASGKVVPKPIS